MKINPKFPKFQEGGEIPAGDPSMGAPEELMAEQAPQEGGGDPLMQVAEMAMLALQSQDCQVAMQVCEMFVLMLQQAQGGGAELAPAGEPVFRRGGKLAYKLVK